MRICSHPVCCGLAVSNLAAARSGGGGGGGGSGRIVRRSFVRGSLSAGASERGRCGRGVVRPVRAQRAPGIIIRFVPDYSGRDERRVGRRLSQSLLLTDDARAAGQDVSRASALNPTAPGAGLDTARRSSTLNPGASAGRVWTCPSPPARCPATPRRKPKHVAVPGSHRSIRGPGSEAGKRVMRGCHWHGGFFPAPAPGLTGGRSEEPGRGAHVGART